MEHTTVIIKNTSIKLYFTDRNQMFNIKSTATINATRTDYHLL